MERTQRFGVLPALVLLLISFGSSLALGQSTVSGHRPAQSAIVILAVDLRELTSLRDVPHVGDVFFRRTERRQNRANDDYDLAIRGSVASDWKRVFGASDENRAPHVFAIEPGTYIIEKINIGGGPTTIGRALMHKATPLVSVVSRCEKVRF